MSDSTSDSMSDSRTGRDGRTLVWSNSPFSDDDERRLLGRLHEADPRVRLVRPAALPDDTLTESPPDPAARRADVLYGQPRVDDIIEGRARWVALSSAGYTRYDTPRVREALATRGGVLTNASSFFDEPCAQHALAMLLAGSRDLPSCLEDQKHARWQSQASRRRCLLMNRRRVVIVGYGAIGERLAELLAPLTPHVAGLRRTVRGTERVPCVAFEDTSAVIDLLGNADDVVNILPAADATRHWFDADRFALLKSGVRYFNIGRGTTTDQQALRAALVSGRLASAWIDVTDPEPPARDDPVWSVPRLYITPHSAGGYDDEFRGLSDHFADQFARWAGGKPLHDKVF